MPGGLYNCTNGNIKRCCPEAGQQGQQIRARAALGTWQNLANKTVFKRVLMRDNSQRQLSQMSNSPSEMRFSEGDSAKAVLVRVCILSPLRLPFRHIGVRRILLACSRRPSGFRFTTNCGSVGET